MAKNNLPLILTIVAILFLLSNTDKIKSPFALGDPNQCNGDINVYNSQSSILDNEQNVFSVAVTNTGSIDMNIEVHDELYLDANCNGIRDDLEGGDISQTFVDLGLWNILLTAGSTQTLQWSRNQWINGDCYIHTILYCSQECTSGYACWEEAMNGNVIQKQNQAQFSIRGIGPTTTTTTTYPSQTTTTTATGATTTTAITGQSTTTTISNGGSQIQGDNVLVKFVNDIIGIVMSLLDYVRNFINGILEWII